MVESQRVRSSTPDHLQASPGFLVEHKPRAGFGGSLPHPTPPRLDRVPTPHSGGVSGREQRHGGLSARPPLALGFCSFSFSLDAQPRDCASFLLRVLQGPRAGARTHPRPGAPLPLPRWPPCLLPRSPHSPPGPHRARDPVGGALGRPRGAQQLPQPEAGEPRRNAPSRRRRC